jgi:RNase P/RNase MRP subunit p29
MRARTHLIRRAMEGKLIAESINTLRFQTKSGMKVTISKKHKENK